MLYEDERDMPERTGKRPETWAARGLGWIDEDSRSFVEPIITGTTYLRDQDYALHKERNYTRDVNPIYERTEAVLNRLEGGRETKLYASGAAATGCIFQALDSGDHVVSPESSYFGTRKWLMEVGVRHGISHTFYRNNDLVSLAAAIQPGKTKVVWVETPANPTWEVTDIRAAAKLAHDAGAILAVDNTVPTPVLTRPLEMGADLSVHSATKYLAGHNDVMAGAIVSASDDHPLWAKARDLRWIAGPVLGPFETWLLQRGMRTLFVRVERQCANALAFARHFDGHPKLEQVAYPGLQSHPDHSVAASQMTGGYGGMLSVRVKGGLEGAKRCVAGMRLFFAATSLGGVESLVEHRKIVEGEDSPVPDDLLRLSIGIENIDDLVDDLERGLAAA